MMRIHYAQHVELVPQEPGEFEFSCQTGVIRGESIVE
jgi:plastocyanin domain-containing protein